MILSLLVLAAAQAATPPAEPPLPLPAHFSAEAVAVLIAGFDADRDGTVSRAELDAGAMAVFGNDGDSMGLLDLTRWSVRWLGHQGARPGRFDFDSDGDDRITRAEFAAELARQFDRLDTDRNGVLIRSELIRIDTSALPRGPVPRGRSRIRN